MTESLRHLWGARPFRNACLIRGITAWMIVRFMAAYLQMGVGHLLLSAFNVGIAALLVALDARRRNEDLFLGNLGIGTWAVAGIAALPAALLEGVLQTVWGR